MAQYFFLDESGEPGIQSQRGSSYFVMAMVQMASWGAIPELISLRKNLHLSPAFEFHYIKMTATQKIAFYQAITPIDFRVRAITVLKDSLPAVYREMSGFELAIELLTKLILRASPLDIGNDVLMIDSATDAFRSALRIRLSHECRLTKRVRPFNKIVTAKSHREDGLQLADMIAGALRDNAIKNNLAYQQTFSKKIVDLWEIK